MKRKREKERIRQKHLLCVSRQDIKNSRTLPLRSSLYIHIYIYIYTRLVLVGKCYNTYRCIYKIRKEEEHEPTPSGYRWKGFRSIMPTRDAIGRPLLWSERTKDGPAHNGGSGCASRHGGRDPPPAEKHTAPRPIRAHEGRSRDSVRLVFERKRTMGAREHLRERPVMRRTWWAVVLYIFCFLFVFPQTATNWPIDFFSAKDDQLLLLRGFKAPC